MFTKRVVTVLSVALVMVLSGCGNAGEAEKHYQAGLRLQEQGRLDEAIAEYDQAITLNPESAEAYYYRGNAYIDLDLFERAVQDFDEAQAGL